MRAFAINPYAVMRAAGAEMAKRLGNGNISAANASSLIYQEGWTNNRKKVINKAPTVLVVDNEHDETHINPTA